MGFEPAPFDVVEASRRVWLERWEPEAASGMAVFTAILRSYQLLDRPGERGDADATTSPSPATRCSRGWRPTRSRRCTLSWISKTLRIPPATVTNIIDRLEADELVRRVPHPSDARTTLAVITARGRKLADRRDARPQRRRCTSASASPRRSASQLIELLAELRANGNEFDVERSDEVIEGLGSRSRAATLQ